MRRIITISVALICFYAAHAQRLADSWKPVPAAVCEKAPLPPDIAEKYAQLEKERRAKYMATSSSPVPAVNADIKSKKTLHLYSGADGFDIRRKAGQYSILLPELRLMNSSHGREKIKGKEGKFNPKKDRISYAVIQNGTEICIVNHDHKLVDMSAFTFTTNSEAISMEGNKVIFNVSVLAIAAGHYPWKHEIVCVHTASGAKYTFDLQFVWTKQLNESGELHAYALTRLGSTAADNLGVLCDLDLQQFRVVQLPLLIEADGYNGANGRNGHSGAAGTNQRSWKDKDGNTHTTQGTCGKPGENGTDGQDGTDGGRFLLCLSPDMTDTYGLDGLIVTIDAGLGGKGGKGGQGGAHGKGSGCSGRAENGRDGRDGKDGQRGDFLYVRADVDAFCQQIFNNASQP